MLEHTEDTRDPHATLTTTSSTFTGREPLRSPLIVNVFEKVVEVSAVGSLMFSSLKPLAESDVFLLKPVERQTTIKHVP